MVRQWQGLFYDNRLSGVDLEGNPDFVKLANAYGIKGFRIKRPADVDKIIQKALDYNEGPCVIHAEVEPPRKSLSQREHHTGRSVSDSNGEESGHGVAARPFPRRDQVVTNGRCVSRRIDAMRCSSQESQRLWRVTTHSINSTKRYAREASD